MAWSGVEWRGSGVEWSGVERSGVERRGAGWKASGGTARLFRSSHGSPVCLKIRVCLKIGFCLVVHSIKGLPPAGELSRGRAVLENQDPVLSRPQTGTLKGPNSLPHHPHKRTI